jgi:hypothetical protein
MQAVAAEVVAAAVAVVAKTCRLRRSSFAPPGYSGGALLRMSA